MDKFSDYLGRIFTPAHPPGILLAQYYKVGANYNCYRPEGTKDWLIMYTLAGKGVVFNKQREYACQKGSLVIIPPGTAQIYYTAENSFWEKMWCHFIPKTQWTELLKLPQEYEPLLILHIDNESTRIRIENAFQRVIGYSVETMNLFWEELSYNALHEILYLMALVNSHQEHAIDPRISDIIQYLGVHYMEDIRIEQLAKRACLSPSRLSHLFKQQIGESIIDILIKIRLKQAERLLKFTQRSITDIAFDVGFNSLDYFTRKFSEFFGTNPSSYRKQHLGVVVP